VRDREPGALERRELDKALAMVNAAIAAAQAQEAESEG